MKNTNIEWATHTWSGWEGCSAVSPGCLHCYAATRNARFAGGTAVNWGPGAPRRRMSERTWNAPLAWNADPFAACTACGWEGHDSECAARARCPQCGGDAWRAARARVFCASLSDVFDNEVAPQWRADVLRLIEATPNLDWLVLTKRVGNVAAMLPTGWLKAQPNVWLGASIVNQLEADRDIAKLVAQPARGHFVSMEPLLGAVDLRFRRGSGVATAARTAATATAATIRTTTSVTAARIAAAPAC